ncbi:MAG TPA: class I SAM-dependent methyltransferase [Bryobacteraceae bacterium]|jgi:2-polyprenyl-3-methyl-5-hydroxy-6-metoxy-1,4-benzoquinol methylase|nr:class I SAM-dependent methyltransferase [Bryobacteraceae bacterium]
MSAQPAGPANVAADETRAGELAAAIREIRERVRSRYPSGSLPGAITAPDLMPLVHARDAAEAKVAAIGAVNPRPPGLINSLVQSVKKLIARGLDWHVREQVEFNRAAMGCVQATLEALADMNRALSQLAGCVESCAAEFRAEARELKDIREHWSQWRAGQEEKANRNEIYMLRTISELNASFQHRATLTENEFRQAMRDQHASFENALQRAAGEIQQRLWADLERMRAQYEKLIYDELRVVRQRAAANPPAASPPPPPDYSIPEIDWLRFADRFRGTEERIRRAQQLYVEYFRGASGVLDVGCGRGEFLESARAAGIEARGIDLSEENVALCRRKGLDVERADVFEYLAGAPERSFGGVFCSQMIEHLAPAHLPRLIRLIGRVLRPGSPAVFETPNPECLAIFATHFYLDPTHTRPVPAGLLTFYLEEAGFGRIDVKYLSPAIETMPALGDLPERFRDSFFGGLDYAVFARKL